MKKTTHLSKDWAELNKRLLEIDDVKKLTKMLDEEKKGKKRKAYMKRIHSRLNIVRRASEREQLGVAS